MKWESFRTWFKKTEKPSRNKQRKPGAERDGSPTERRILFMAYALCVIVLAIDAYTVFINLSRGQKAEVPVELLGMWVTNAQGYTGRALEITDSTVTFHAGETGKLTYAIDKVGADRQERATFYIMHYGGWSEGSEIGLRYVAVPSAAITLQNQQHVTWRRQNTN